MNAALHIDRQCGNCGNCDWCDFRAASAAAVADAPTKALIGLVSELAEREPRFGYSSPCDLTVSMQDAVLVLRADSSVLADAFSDAHAAGLMIESLARCTAHGQDSILSGLVHGAVLRQVKRYLLPLVKDRCAELDEKRQVAFEVRKYGRTLNEIERERAL